MRSLDPRGALFVRVTFIIICRFCINRRLLYDTRYKEINEGSGFVK